MIEKFKKKLNTGLMSTSYSRHFTEINSNIILMNIWGDIGDTEQKVNGEYPVWLY